MNGHYIVLKIARHGLTGTSTKRSPQLTAFIVLFVISEKLVCHLGYCSLWGLNLEKYFDTYK